MALLRSLPALLGRDEIAGGLERVGSAGRARARPGLRAGRPRPCERSPPTRRRGAHDHRRRAPRPRPARLPGLRRGRCLPRLGDASVRAGQPERRDHGTPPPRAVAPARPGPHAAPAGRAGARARAATRSPRRGRRARACSRAAPAASTRPNWLRVWSRPATAASIRSSTEVRSRCAARSSTCSLRPPTAPVRIDLWDDEVDRLTEFSVTDQRSTGRRRVRRAVPLS